MKVTGVTWGKRKDMTAVEIHLGRCVNRWPTFSDFPIGASRNFSLDLSEVNGIFGALWAPPRVSIN